jgi:hypothetical protein
MRELGPDKLVIELRNTEEDVLFIASPNYEARSAAFFESFMPLFDDQNSVAKIHLSMLSLQSKLQQNLVLDKIKWSRIYNIEKHLKTIEGKRLSWSQRTITYPHEFSSEQFGMFLAASSKYIAQPFIVCLDISGLPRKIILTLIQQLHAWVHKGTLSKWYLIYAQPQRYPKIGRPADVGTLRLAEGGISLTEFLEGSFDVHGVVVPGREGVSSTLFIDTLPHNSQVDAYIYLAKNNPRSSLETIYANSAFCWLLAVNISWSSNTHKPCKRLTSFAQQ